jgi:hypothetical protein
MGMKEVGSVIRPTAVKQAQQQHRDSASQQLSTMFNSI